MIATLVVSALIGLGASQPQMLIGKWETSGETPADPNGRRMGWTRLYKLAADGSFVMTGYPEIEVKGRWAATTTDGKKFVIELTKQKMGATDWIDAREDAQLEAPDKLRWAKDLYTRQK